MSDEHEFEPFCLPDNDKHPAVIAERLYLLPEHSHLKELDAHVEFLMRKIPKIKQGRQILGTCCMPMVQGELRDMFDWMIVKLFGTMPDFLIILDKDYWDESTPKQREILTYHELCHAKQALDQYGVPKFDKEGLPVWRIAGHDVEEFTAVVRAYGAWNDELREFMAAAQS